MSEFLSPAERKREEARKANEEKKALKEAKKSSDNSGQRREKTVGRRQKRRQELEQKMEEAKSVVEKQGKLGGVFETIILVCVIAFGGGIMMFFNDMEKVGLPTMMGSGLFGILALIALNVYNKR